MSITKKSTLVRDLLDKDRFSEYINALDNDVQELCLFTQSRMSGGILVGVDLSAKDNGDILAYNASTEKWECVEPSAAAMVYPGAGIALSTGVAWDTSITDNSANWNTAYGWGNHADAGYLTSLSGAVLTDQTSGQTIGLTGSRLTKLWATDIEVTNAISGSVTGNAGTVTNGVYTTDFPLNQNTTGQAGTVATITGLAPDTQNTYARTQYLIPYADTTTSFGEIAIGTATHVLTSNGPGAAPSFQAVAGGAGDLKADGTVPLTANWDVGNFSLTMNNLTSDGTITDGTASLTGGVLNGLTDINATATTDLNLFGNTDVDNAVDGKQLIVNRMAAEGNGDIKLYVNNGIQGVITTGCNTFSIRGLDSLQLYGANANSKVKLQPFSAGNITCFEDTDIDDSTDGKSFYIYRKAAEGDGYLQQYLDASGSGKIYFNGYNNSRSFTIRNSSGGEMFLDATNGLRFNYDGRGNASFFSSADNGENPTLQQAGYITAGSDAKYIQWQVNDSTDNFELTREDSNIGAFDIKMPLTINSAYTLPTADGTDGQVLTSDGAGTVAWEDAGGGTGVWTDGSGNIYPTTAADNVTIGGTTDAGTSGEGVLVMEIGVTPTTSPANCIQLYPEDVGAGYGSDVFDNSSNISLDVGTPYNLANIIDEDTSTWGGDDGHGGANKSLKYDFGSGVTKTITKFTLGANTTTYASMPSAFLLQGSNNDSDWDTLDSDTGLTWTADQERDYEFVNTTGYRYYRVYYTAIQSGDECRFGFWAGYETSTSLAELKVRDEAGNVTTLSPHNFNNISKEKKLEIQEESDEMAWAYHSEKDGKSITVDMWSAIRDLEKTTGNQYIYMEDAEGNDISKFETKLETK